MGAPKVQGGMTFEERQALLRDEERMAEEREAHQREILALEEAQREARERAQRMQSEQEEAARLAEIERMELEGAEVSQETEEATEQDTDVTVANLYSALALGTDTTERPD